MRWGTGSVFCIKSTSYDSALRAEAFPNLSITSGLPKTASPALTTTVRRTTGRTWRRGAAAFSFAAAARHRDQCARKPSEDPNGQRRPEQELRYAPPLFLPFYLYLNVPVLLLQRLRQRRRLHAIRDLAGWITGYTLNSEVPAKISGSSFLRWFGKHKGEVRRKISKPELSAGSKTKRVTWATEFLKLREKRKYYCYLDEKWFSLESRREKRKLLWQPGETEEEAEHEHVSAQNRRFPMKRMYIGVVGEPLFWRDISGRE